MYASDMTIYPSEPWIPLAIYNQLAEVYKLPTVVQLITSLDESIPWQGVDPETQIYYLDNLKEANKRHLFQVRFKTRKEARAFTSLFLSVNEDNTIHTLSLAFPTPGDRGCSSRLIGWLKEFQKNNNSQVEFEISGYAERNTLRDINEQVLSAFVYQPQLQRYLHVTDVVREVKEVKKGLMRQ